MHLSKISNVCIVVAAAFCMCTPLAVLSEVAEQSGQPGTDEQGAKLEAVLSNDYFAVVHGGAERGSAIMGNFDLTLEVDTQKMGWWDGGTVFLYGLANYGDAITKSVGNVQVIDNIETYSTAKLYEAWYEHSFLDKRISVLLGLHDLNSEFAALDYAGTLINSSFGISTEIAQVGPSIFSYTAPAARIRVLPGGEAYIQSALYDGVPGDPNNPRGTRVRYHKNEGLLWITEVGMLSPDDLAYNGHRKIAAGFWYHTKEFEDPNGQVVHRNHGIYLIGEHALVAESDVAQGLGLFWQTGFARNDVNPISLYFGGGLTYTGIIPERNEDVLSLGYAHARRSDAYGEAAPGSDHIEGAIELTYHALISESIAIQPDLQYIINPGFDPQLDNALAIGVRVEVGL